MSGRLARAAIAASVSHGPTVPGRWIRLAYASGGLVDGVMFNALNIFLFFYLSTATSIPIQTTATVLGLAMMTDALITPVIGLFSDRLKGPLGRRFPLMVVAVPMAALSIYLLFTLAEAHVATLLPRLVLLVVVARVSLAMYHLQHLALGAEMPQQYAERARLSAMRWFFNICGGLIAVAAGFTWQMMEPDKAGPDAFRRFALLLSSIIAAGGIGGCIVAWRLRPFSTVGPGAPADASRSFAALVREALSHRTFRLLMVGSGIFFTGFSIANLLNLHAKTAFWKLEPAQLQAVLLAHFGSLLLAAPIAALLIPRFEKKTIACTGLLLFILAQAGPVSIRLAGGLEMSQADVTALLMVTSACAGLSLGISGSTLNSMMGDVADDHELARGNRLQGTFFSATAFANKVANGLGILVTGVALDFLGFSTQDGVSAQEVQALGVLYGPLAGLLSALAIVPLMFYHIDRRHHASVFAILARRNGRA